jgi:hypothetical protein
MKGKRIYFAVIMIFSGLLVALFLSLVFPFGDQAAPAPVQERGPGGEEAQTQEPPPPPLSAVPDEQVAEQVLLDVAFTSQAPLGQWQDDKYQNACEEASVLMAWHWIQKDDTLTPQEATDVIADMVSFQRDRYGFFIDSSARDTARFFRDYYAHQGVSVTGEVSTDSIRRELSRGNLIIVPANGQLLGNPNFTPPGPARHMVVIIGHDDARGVFVTNDPGTRNGEGYEYDYDVLLSAVRDYPSGDHSPILSESKAMIVVSRD